MKPRYRQSGFSYVEAMIATTLIAISLVPALEALQGGIQGSDIHFSRAENHNRLREKIEQVLATPFALLGEQADIAGGATVVVDRFSDDPGTAGRRLVYLAHYDGDANNFSVTESGLIWLRVAIENSNDELQTLTTR